MEKILLFAGTTEGRILWEELNKRGLKVIACVATEYGESVLNKYEDSLILQGRLMQSEIIELIRKQGVTKVIDATHPYAVVITDNIKAACMEVGIIYFRVLRSSIATSNHISVKSIQDAVEYLNMHPGNALITTGSKELFEYTKVDNFKERLTCRILPDLDGLKQCIELGFPKNKIICMQGPFSKDMNALVLKECNATYLVTKEGGTYGGFIEKEEAVKQVNAKLIVINRPREEKGYTIEEILYRC